MRREHIKQSHSVKRNSFAIPVASIKLRTNRVRSGGDGRGEATDREWVGLFMSLRYEVDHSFDMMRLGKHIKRGDRVESVATGKQLLQITRQRWRIA
jgi:hypothetical protein